MIELQGLQLSFAEFEKLGVQIVAVSPDPAEKSQGVVDKLGLSFPILSDSELALTRALGLEHEGAGPNSSTIPRPATFIVRNGRIVWRNLTENYRIRPKPEELLSALADLGVGSR
jgi:peroxiredoxin